MVCPNPKVTVWHLWRTLRAGPDPGRVSMLGAARAAPAASTSDEDRDVRDRWQLSYSAYPSSNSREPISSSSPLEYS